MKNLVFLLFVLFLTFPQGTVSMGDPFDKVEANDTSTEHIFSRPVPKGSSFEQWFNLQKEDFHFAVLIAGSSGFENYRHQADVCHAYQILRNRGFEDDQIITFVFDDIAYNSMNPYPGRLFNSYRGQNVYPGCAKDYTGLDVNKRNLMAVLTGDSTAVAGIGSERVLNKNPNQKVFIFCSDHGGDGLLGMPVENPITSGELKRTVDEMIERKMFKELVFYVEACHGGSMFKGMGYDKMKNVLLVSASSADENSWDTYCAIVTDNRLLKPRRTFICFGDTFSVSWMEYTESHSTASVLISEQLEYTTKRTATFNPPGYRSNVTIFADPDHDIRNEVVGSFLSCSKEPHGNGLEVVVSQPSFDNPPGTSPVQLSPVGQREADLVFWTHESKSSDKERRAAGLFKLERVLADRKRIDTSIRAMVGVLMKRGLLSLMHTLEDYLETHLARREDQALVDDWDCFQIFVEKWGSVCGKLSPYARRYTRTFANLCNLKVTIEQFTDAVEQACSKQEALLIT